MLCRPARFIIQAVNNRRPRHCIGSLVTTTLRRLMLPPLVVRISLLHTGGDAIELESGQVRAVDE